jgi:hypothetical protein
MFATFKWPDHHHAACRFMHRDWVTRSQQFDLEVLVHMPSRVRTLLTQFSSQIIICTFLLTFQTLAFCTEYVLNKWGLMSGKVLSEKAQLMKARGSARYLACTCRRLSCCDTPLGPKLVWHSLTRWHRVLSDRWYQLLMRRHVCRR